MCSGGSRLGERNSENKRIARNTVILYVRMIFSLAISLYSSRIVLQSLGIIDYGIYNIVGGVVSMLNFLSAAMGNSTQRYISFALGKKDVSFSKSVFSCAMVIHAVLAVFVVILAETVGLFFLNNYLNIPSDRFNAASVLYHISVLTVAVTIMMIPYNATVIAFEKMDIYAILAILDSVLKLVIAISLPYIGHDRLVIYGGLLFILGLTELLICWAYCRRHLGNARFEKSYIDKPLLLKMFSFAGWSLIGNLAFIGYTQGLNMLLNIFFGVTVNAARSLAVQIQGAIRGFVTNFQMAINPQITKTYASGDLSRMHSLVYASSKYSFFLLLCIILPLSIEINFVLKLWLVEVPDHTALFTLLTFGTMLVDPLSNPLSVSVQATGNIKKYQIIEGGTLLTILPLAYIALKLGCAAKSVFYIQIVVMYFVQILRILIVCHMIGMKISDYLKNVVIRILLVLVLSPIVPMIVYIITNRCTFSFFMVVLLSIFSVIIVSYCFGMTGKERSMFNMKIRIFLKNKNNN